MAGKRNGELLRLAELEFDAFLTADRKLQYQENLSAFNIAVVVMVARSNSLLDLQPLIPRILEMLPSTKRGQATVGEGKRSASFAVWQGQAVITV